MSKKNPEIRARFDRYLASYQKISVFLLFPPLITAFSCFVALFAKDYNLSLSMNFALAIKNMVPEHGLMIAIISSLALSGAFVFLALRSAKGKLPFYLIGASLYLVDFVYGFFILDLMSNITKIVGIASHAIFLGVYIVGIVFYSRANALLKAHGKDIL